MNGMEIVCAKRFFAASAAAAALLLSGGCGGGGDGSGPLLPPVGDRLVFVSDRDGADAVFVTSARSGEAVSPPVRVSAAGAKRPALSPNGRRVAYVAARPSGAAGSDIFVSNVNGTDPRRVTNADARDSGAFNAEPAFSPDGRFLAYVRDRALCVTDLDAADPANARVLTPPGILILSIAGGLTWSPDGSYLVCPVDTPGLHGETLRSSLHRVAADGSGITRLARPGDGEGGPPIEGRFPCFSPDGARIVFSNPAPNLSGGGVDYVSEEIYVMNADGSGVVRLTDHPAADREPAFGRDGQTIFFTSDRDGNDDIYAMNADGTNLRRLTSVPSGDHSPAVR